MIDESKMELAIGYYTDLVNIIETMDTEEIDEFQEMMMVVSLFKRIGIKEVDDGM